MSFRSVSGNTVALTRSGMDHIAKRHPELKNFDLANKIGIAVESPDYVVQGKFGRHIAVRSEPMMLGKAKYGCDLRRWRRSDNSIYDFKGRKDHQEECIMEAMLKVKTVEALDIDYDRGRDVLYISFGSPTAADDAELLDNDVIVRYRQQRVIGMTVPDFSRRS